MWLTRACSIDYWQHEVEGEVDMSKIPMIVDFEDNLAHVWIHLLDWFFDICKAEQVISWQSVNLASDTWFSTSLFVTSDWLLLHMSMMWWTTEHQT